MHPEAICQIVGAVASNKDSTSAFLYSSIHSQAVRQTKEYIQIERDRQMLLFLCLQIERGASQETPIACQN